MIHDDFFKMMSEPPTLSTEEQKQAGKPSQGKMSEEHKKFLQTVIALIDSGQIDPYAPESLLNKQIYDSLDEPDQGKIDQALLNIADMVRMIEEFFRSTETPDESPQLQEMIDYLWQIKQRAEKVHDIFKF
ncbi:hypothetical protein A2635_02560 [Candidatus Peribacteria bacterium RIFCSPHIGHO2_01_FULL_51_9]|nr:MAG: hypothetical protein A2635_02560 [Candidatus Peribacteria bacterium RIFCSPHIGHO2_01_FULL_51_9]